MDFGKLADYSVLMVLKRETDIVKIVYMYEFPLETLYSQVIGHLARANQKFVFRKMRVDQTGVGEPVLEEIRNQGIRNMKGLMKQNRLAIPYHRQLCEQINEQQYSYSKSGHLQFSHPENSHEAIQTLDKLTETMYISADLYKTVRKEIEKQATYLAQDDNSKAKKSKQRTNLKNSYNPY